MFATQFWVTRFLFPETPFYYTLVGVYSFHFCVTFLMYLFLVFVNTTFFDKTGYTFLATGILKMMASIVFLMPLIQSEFENKIPDVGAFFIPFFLFLLFETIHSVRLLNPK
jgi:hypothetical protein